MNQVSYGDFFYMYVLPCMCMVSIYKYDVFILPNLGTVVSMMHTSKFPVASPNPVAA